MEQNIHRLNPAKIKKIIHHDQVDSVSECKVGLTYKISLILFSIYIE